MTHDTDTITRLADKLMRWPLPESLCSDGCVTKCGAGRSGTNLLSVSDARELLRFLLDAAPEAAEPVAPIELGYGRVEVGEGSFDGKPALIFGRNGTGTIGEATQPNRELAPGEALAVVTFANVASLDVVAAKLATLRSKLAPTDSQAGRDAVEAAADTKRLDALERLAAEFTSVTLHGSKRHASFSVELWGAEDEPADYPNLREAIDALSTTTGRAAE